MLKWEGKVYTEIISDCSKATLQGIIRGHIEFKSIINTDGWIDRYRFKHLRVNQFACGDHHINRIESFLRYAKKGLIKFNEVDKKVLVVFQKVC